MILNADNPLIPPPVTSTGIDDRPVWPLSQAESQDYVSNLTVNLIEDAANDFFGSSFGFDLDDSFDRLSTSLPNRDQVLMAQTLLIDRMNEQAASLRHLLVLTQKDPALDFHPLLNPILDFEHEIAVLKSQMGIPFGDTDFSPYAPEVMIGDGTHCFHGRVEILRLDNTLLIFTQN